MSNGFYFNQSWSDAIWYALRQVTGIPSPQRFEVQKIPLIGAECRRIYTITNQFKNVIFEAEKQVKGVFYASVRMQKELSAKCRN
ncbi:MAG: hypothetical protein K7J15_00825, partial [Candidatus Regiella insecticola]|nr:hypothetical protein [Candidatus Regiella insecticola]